MNYKAPIMGFIWGTLLFLLCALAATYGEKHSLEWLQFVSFAMLIVTPISVGALTLFLIPIKQAEDKSKRKYYAFLPVFGWSIISLIVQWETIICIFMLLPLYLPLAFLGGKIGAGMKVKYKSKYKAGIISCFALAPFLMIPLEQPLTAKSLRYSVTNSIQINAPIERVWRNLSNIENIKPSELKWNISHFIGLPKPQKATTKVVEIGAIREIYWERGVHFQERITNIIPQKLLAYDVIIDEKSMEIAELDTHITVGDQYFNVESGYYYLSEHQGQTYLSLTTSYRMTTKINWYGKFWANFVLDDFHASVLHMIKLRNEKKNPSNEFI